jgi:formamidopyrimidine-DNA glycosylase
LLITTGLSKWCAKLGKIYGNKPPQLQREEGQSRFQGIFRAGFGSGRLLLTLKSITFGLSDLQTICFALSFKKTGSINCRHDPMPELPEVEGYRQYLEATSLHQPIEAIDVEDIKLLTTDQSTLTEALHGTSFTGTRRVGKNLFVFTDRPGVIVRMHFGMTGDLEYYHSSLDRPRHARIVFYFRSGFNLGFICPRKFERIGLVGDVDVFLKKKKIGKDALELTAEELSAVLATRKGPVKSVLLDQSVAAGVGNWIADELLYQAGILPEKPANELSPAEVEALWEATGRVLRTAIDKEARYADFPASYLIHARAWDTSPYEEASQHLLCPRCQSEIKITRIGGRTTYYCADCQS